MINIYDSDDILIGVAENEIDLESVLKTLRVSNNCYVDFDDVFIEYPKYDFY